MYAARIRLPFKVQFLVNTIVTNYLFRRNVSFLFFFYIVNACDGFQFHFRALVKVCDVTLSELRFLLWILNFSVFNDECTQAFTFAICFN